MSELPFYGHVIDGVEDGQESFDSVDPWTRQPWARVALGGPDEARRAVAAARQAFDKGPWPRLGFEERGRIMHRLADLVERDAEALAGADTHDMGKPTGQARHDVARTARNLRFFADHARLTVADALPMDSGHHAYTRFDPAGVVVAISPWNFPLMLASWKVAPALAWGNPVVLKPSEDAPVSATLLARLAREAGVPAGVLNVVHGYGRGVGQALVADSRVDRVTFTGSSATGRVIASAAGANLTPVSLELGGKGANLVFADADLDNALAWSLRAIFHNTGQVCLAGSRLYVQRPVYDEFLVRFAEAAAAMRVGSPTASDTEVGPLSSEHHFAKVTGYVDTVTEHGGKIIAGGRGEGWSVSPTVVTDLPGTAPHWQEEIFGPVVVVSPFDTEAEAVAAANGTPYGLNAMLFTEDLHRAHRVAGALRAGTVWVNCFYVRDLRAPFGGVGASGIGREGGVYSREFFTEPKAVVMQLNGVQSSHQVDVPVTNPSTVGGSL